MLDPHIAQIPESDKEKHCPCHANTFEHKASAHQGEDAWGGYCPADMFTDENRVRFASVEESL